MDKISPKKTATDKCELSWFGSDIESRIGLGLFLPARFTDVNTILSFFVGAAICAVLAFGLRTASDIDVPLASEAASRMASGGWINYVTLFLFSWGLGVLWLKLNKLSLQRRALELSLVPSNSEFVLNRDSAVSILKRLRDAVDNPKNFILANRIEIAISNLNNIGQISDVSTILSAQERSDEERIESSYVLTNTLMWVIPILGFIGTVLGLGFAIGGFTETIAGAESISKIKSSLTSVTSGLGSAFDTTLVALVLVVVLQFAAAFVRKREYDFLDDCSAYCQDNVLSKLKIRERE